MRTGEKKRSLHLGGRAQIKLQVIDSLNNDGTDCDLSA